MKSYDQTRIRRVEIAQLIVLQSLFAQVESRDIIFQGGTAIRWFLGGLRFSEDLDFVTPMRTDRVAALVDQAAVSIRRHMVANFGSGELSIALKSRRRAACHALVDFAPAGERGKIRVKAEFERLAQGCTPRTEPVIMQSFPAVAWFLRQGGFRTAGANVVVNVETAPEMLTDKLRALMERPYTKGRDFFDVWFLNHTLSVRASAEDLRRKLGMYATPFHEKTPARFFAELDTLAAGKRRQLVREIRQDLSRFLDLDTLEVLARGDFSELLTAVQDAFRNVAG